MKVRDILGVAAVAAVTMAFVLAMLGPVQVGAEDPPKGIKPMIAQPKLTVDGCEFTLATDKPAYKQGESPVLTVEATNPTDKPVETTVRVNMSGFSPASFASRRMPTAQSLWLHDCRVVLAPGETKTVTLPTKVELSALMNVSLTLANAEQKVLANMLSVQQNGRNGQANMNTTGQAVNVTAFPEN